MIILDVGLLTTDIQRLTRIHRWFTSAWVGGHLALAAFVASKRRRP
ncbi:MAG: hypothetical protein FWJ93_05805 [Micromonosporaceae bacterium]